jgi:hypothetical protein
MNHLLVNQYFGLGDIIYVQTLLEDLSKNYNILFPIADEYYWIVPYLKSNQNINYIKKSQCSINLENPYPTENYFPLRWATQLHRKLSPTDYSHDHTVMEDKYLIFNKDPKSWIKHEFVRDYVKENELYELLGSPTNFVLINNNFGSNTVGAGKSNISKLSEEKVVELSIKKGYTMFDWLKVVENAKEIHTISTSLVFLCDKYANEHCKKSVYIRNNNNQTLDALKNILITNWDFIYQ